MVYLVKYKHYLENLVDERTKELRKREKLLKESNEKLTVTINSIGDIFFSTDKEGRIEYINPIGEELLAYTLKELKGKYFKDIFKFTLSQNDTNQIYPIKKVIKKGLTVSHEEPIIIKNKEGKFIHVLDKATPIYNSQKEIIGTVIIFKDITKIYQLLEELRQTQKLESIGQLSGGIAHDFNNMLMGILGAAEVLLLEDNITNVCKENLEVILKSAQRAGQLTRKLLDFSRKGGTYKKIINTETEINDTLKLIKRSIDKKIQIITNFRAKDKYIKIDSSQLQNSIINLILNSRDAIINKEPKIEIITDNFYANKEFCKNSLFKIQEGHYLAISVKDNGKGMPQEVKERIFEPFFTTKEVGKGTGLGLSAVYGTVIDYKGFLNVDTQEGKGTTITLYFPVIKDYKEKESENLQNQTTKSKNNGYILIVDDEEGVRSVAVKMLKKLGYSVYEASNGKEAVEIYKEKKDEILLVIMDIVMPEMDGREAFYKLKEIKEEVKVILLSGFTKETSINLLMKDGLKGFLLKPYTIKSLDNKINEVLS